MDLTGFYATVSGVGFTLLGLWWIVVDKHPEWFERRDTARMAYVVSLQFIIPATASLLSLVAADLPGLWRTVFTLLGLVGIAGAVLVARVTRGHPGVSAVALLSALPVYVAMVVVAVLPPLDVGLTPLQLEALLVSLIWCWCWCWGCTPCGSSATTQPFATPRAAAHPPNASSTAGQATLPGSITS